MTPQHIAALPYRPCVGIMLANTNGQVFVAQRNDRDTDAWQMPQGGVDPGEDTRTAALRELQEETSVTPDLVMVEAQSAERICYDLPIELVPKIWKGRYRGQEQTWYLLRFLGRDSDINLQTDQPEFTAWRWLDPGDLVAQIVPFKRAVYQQVVAEFGPRLAR